MPLLCKCETQTPILSSNHEQLGKNLKWPKLRMAVVGALHDHFPKNTLGNYFKITSIVRFYK
jgi:hypothetical protein